MRIIISTGAAPAVFAQHQHAASALAQQPGRATHSLLRAKALAAAPSSSSKAAWARHPQPHLVLGLLVPASRDGEAVLDWSAVELGVGVRHAQLLLWGQQHSSSAGAVRMSVTGIALMTAGC